MVAPDNSFCGLLAKDDKPVMTMQMAGWAPNWGYVGAPMSHDTAADGLLKIRAPWTIAGTKVTVGCTARKTGPRTVAYQYEFDSPKDLPITQLTTQLGVKNGMAGKIVLTHADGRQQNLAIPQHKVPEVADVAKLAFQIEGMGEVVVTLDPPCHLYPEEGYTRVELAHGLLKTGKNLVAMTVTFPGPVEFSGPEMQNKYVVTLAGPTWFPFKGSNDLQPSALGFEDWLDKPAGKHGGVRMKGSAFEFEDGTPIKFWGTNLCYGWECAPPKAAADLAAARFAKWGVNAVRLHKPCGPGDVGDPLTHQVRSGCVGADGIFRGPTQETRPVFRHVAHLRLHVRPGNKDRYLAYDEIKDQLGGSTSGLINYAPDVQDLLIEMVVNLLKHKNPHTGLTWAQEPALAYIELHNEDDIFWFASAIVMRNARPTRKT